MDNDFLEDLIEVLPDIEANDINKPNKSVRIKYTLLIVFGHKPETEMMETKQYI